MHASVSILSRCELGVPTSNLTHKIVWELNKMYGTVRNCVPSVVVLGPTYTPEDRVVGVVVKRRLQKMGINVEIDDHCSAFMFGSETWHDWVCDKFVVFRLNIEGVLDLGSV